MISIYSDAVGIKIIRIATKIISYYTRKYLYKSRRTCIKAVLHIIVIMYIIRF